MFARNVIDDVVKIVNLEEQRRSCLVELDASQKRIEVKKNRRRKRELVNEDIHTIQNLNGKLLSSEV